MANNNSKPPKDQTHHTLRIISAVSAAFGIDINVISMIVVRHGFKTNGPYTLMTIAYLPLVLSILWALADIYSNRLWNGRIRPRFYVLVDGIGFLSFFALLVTNGIILGDLNNFRRRNSRVILLTYNTLPWIVCAIMHFIIVLRTTLRSLNVNKFPSLLRPHAVCPNCSRTWNNQARRVAGEAGESLLGEEGEEDVEENPKGKGAIRLEDDVEGPTTGQRS